MAGSAVKVEFDVRDLTAKIGRYQKRLKNISMAVVAEILQTAVDNLIQSEGVEGTQGRWKGFSPVTFKIHPEREGGSLLQATGQLANMQPSEGDWYAMVTSSAPYAGYHITGTRKPDMPSRDFFALKFDEVLDEIGDMILEEVERG